MMKKSLLYSAAVLATWSMTSCSNEVLDDGLNHEAGQIIELAVENAGSGLANRSGRPLLSSEADQNIDNVYVFVVENTTTQGENGKQNVSSKVLAVNHLDSWNKPSPKIEDYNDASGHGRKTRIEVKIDKEQWGNNATSTYAIYAIGYSSDTKLKVGQTSLDDYLKNIAANATDKTFENLVLTNSNPVATQADEFFAGKATIKFSDEKNKKFSQGITLHRQVAGVFNYVKNVPYMLDNTGNVCSTLQLVASKPNKNIVLGAFYDKTLGQNGSTTIKGEEQKPDVVLKNKLKNVVNGTDAFTEKQVVSTINLNDWFTTLQDENNDGVLDRYDYKEDENGNLVENKKVQLWKNPIKNDDGTYKATFVKGSVFDGQFIIPFQKEDNQQTFALELLSNNKKEVLRTWNINLPADDKVNGILTYWNNGWATSGSAEQAYVENSKNYYSVLRNHLYGVGTKNSTIAPKPQPDPENPDPDPENPDKENPEKPTPDVEDPQDLNTKQDILLQVNDNWEVIHKMEVE